MNQATKLIANDSGQHHVTNRNYLPGGIMNAMFQKCAPMVQMKKTTKGRLGDWSAMAFEHNEKRLEVINLCRIPSSSSNGESC